MRGQKYTAVAVILAVLAGPLFCADAQALMAHVAYNDTEPEVTWEFNWNGILPAAADNFIPPGQNEWNVTVAQMRDLTGSDGVNDPDAVLDDLVLQISHAKGPEGESDKPEVTFYISSIPDLAGTKGFLTPIPQASIVRISGSGIHANKHVDKYTLAYSTTGNPAAGRAINFKVLGQHEVPEPATVFLLSAAALGLRRRTERRRAPEEP